MRQELGSDYEVRFPIMPGTEDDPHYGPWRDRFIDELDRAGDPPVILGHSLGGSVALKCAAEEELVGRVTGLVIVAAPFWGQAEWEREWALPEGWTAEEGQLPPIHLFHSSDDEYSPFSSLDLFAACLPEATVHPLEGYGHLYERGDLSAIVSAVKAP
jgi:serine hydrolase